MIRNRIYSFKKCIHYLLSRFFIHYIEFVYHTSHIRIKGNVELLNVNKDKFIFGYWHGDTFALYPLMKEKKNKMKLVIITTENIRGNYIDSACKHYNYLTFRLPDSSINGNIIFKLRKFVNNTLDLALALDGPMGPIYQPKLFVFKLAQFLNRKIIPVNVKVRYKYVIKKRWDRYKIIFPFNRIEYYIGNPIEIKSNILKHNESLLIKQLKESRLCR